MQLADLESKLMKQDTTDKDVDDVVRECEGPLVLKNTAQAREYIHKLCRIARAQQQNVSLQRQTMKTMATSIEIHEGELENLQKQAETTTEHRLFYQHKLVKLVRDLDLFQHDESRKKELDGIYEFSENMKDQIRFRELIENIDLKKELIDHANRHIGTKQQLGALYQSLEELGLFRDYDPQLDEEPNNSPRARRKTHGKFNKRGAHHKQTEQQAPKIKIMVESGTKEKLKSQIQKALDGNLLDKDAPHATEESG